ncbi:MAG: Rpn family recombination-promoting nuclease/putative transposase, partial [Byssovorax sp.]
VLFEHQSTVDALMPFRLLQYMVLIWERHLQVHSEDKRLPPIVPRRPASQLQRLVGGDHLRGAPRCR